MELKVFSIYDTKGKCYGVPFFMSTIGSAVRAFGDLASDKQSSISKHPSDYILYQIGEYEDAKGGLVAVAPVRNLGFASDYVGPDKMVEPCDDKKLEKPTSGNISEVKKCNP